MGADRRQFPVLLFAGYLVTVWVLAGVAALLALALTRRSTLDRLYERLDLNGRDGKPSNSKVLFTAGVLFAWVIVGAWGTVLVVTRQPLGSAFVWLVTLVLAASAGVDVFKVALKTRLGGLAGALQEHERQRPAAMAAAAEAAERIRQRREVGRDDETEPA